MSDEVMTIEEQMCWRVSVSMFRAAPQELALWPPAWEAIEEPCQEFLRLLPTYRDGGELARRRVEKAGNRVVMAWWEASKEWERLGRPQGRAS